MPIRREYLNDDTNALLAAFQGLQAAMWTAMPCRVNSFDPAKLTITCKPLIRARVVAKDGAVSWVELPLLVDVPVVFPCAGGFMLTFPIQSGDDALVVFSSRCIDAWWDTGSMGNQSDFRMHDLSDGFALVGPRSRPSALSATPVNLEAVELRNDSRDAYVRIRNTGDMVVKTPGTLLAEAGTQITLTAPTVQINGNVNVSGTIVATGNVIGSGKSLATHVHSGVQTGGGNTGAPV